MPKWIWLPEGSYPNRQKTIYSAFMDKSVGNYTVAEFQKTYTFEKEISSVNLRFSADTEFQLFCNEDFAVTGPASVGGDFLGNDKPRPNFYATETAYTPNGKTLSFFARVKMMPVKICDYSKGHGGFLLTAQVIFEDESVIIIGTDESWQVRFNGAYTTPYHFDGRIEPDAFVSAQVTEDIWDVTIAPIPPRTEQKIIPQNGVIHLSAGEERTVELPFDMIYGGFLNMHTEGEGTVYANVNCRELDEQGSCEKVILKGNAQYRGFEMHSAGNLLVQVKNESDSHAVLECALIATHYPVTETAETLTDDEQLNEVLRVCEHTLK